MADLERRLRALAPDAFPPPPDVRAAVAERVAGGEGLSPAPRARRGMPSAPRARRGMPSATRARRGVPSAPGRRRVLALVLALVLVPGIAVAAVPSAREAVLDWLGLASVRVERVPRLPDLPALDRIDLGGRVASLAAASRRSGFPVVAPDALGAPDGLYVTRDGIVSLAYEPRAGLPRDEQTGLGLLVTQARARERPEFLLKSAGPGTAIEQLRVDGNPAVFLSGAPHGLTFERPDGTIGQIEPRLAGNTLLLERDGLVIRLEGRFDRERALSLARSLGP